MGRRAKTNRVPKTRACGNWTEAAYYGFIRSGLRQLSQRWPPISEVLKISRRQYTGPNKRQKWEYECALCKQWFSRKEIEIDHIEPCGTLKSLEDLPGFVGRLLCEVDKLRVTCVACNQSRK